MIYMDAAATAPAQQAVLDTISPLLTHDFGNPASRHELGRNAERAVDWARQTVADELGVAEHEIYFTSGGTESDNLAIIGAALANPRGRTIVTSAIEHPAVLEAAQYLVTYHGFTHQLIPVDHHGLLDLERAAELINQDTAVVSVMAVNNEVGTIQPVAEVVKLAKAAGAFMHTDAVQAAGWLDLKDLSTQVDALSVSGHKIGALKGTGALYYSATSEIVPLLHGGGQQRGIRSGTENPAGAVGIARALQLVREQREAGAGDAYASYLIERITGELDKQFPDAVQLTGHPEQRVGGIVSFVFPRTAGETVLIELERRGVLCSSGSACAAGSTDPSPVLTAMGYEAELAHTAVRLSFTRSMKENEISQVASAVIAVIRSLLS
ncbi:cysteine desulfurase [Glutamicibacter sp. MNS18]|uniref:cysteine desulfurase family protein n=1 Tax=Glutamicibacter sp. MNS18 TaxID=2989817 RepID=UPI002235F002|nr:cysteine desulfurase family protein [Glutamicibacter sp. MNS18]MCW4467196.1 cysteine desulfurase [Glutamicibacter sp. MNS18]